MSALAPPRRDLRRETAAAASAFAAMLARDLLVLRRNPRDVLARTLVQPLLLVFVLGYVQPKVGLGSADAARISTTLLAGMLATAMLTQGIQAVALPLMLELGPMGEIEDRALAPVPLGLVACEKVAVGTLQGLLAALLVCPVALLVPSSAPDARVDWPLLLTLAPLAGLACSSLGLVLATSFDARSAMALFAVLLTPLMFLGCTLYPWSELGTIPWLQALALADPLTYVSEGFRAAVTPVAHLSLVAVYGVLVLTTAGLLAYGTRAFRRRLVE